MRQRNRRRHSFVMLIGLVLWLGTWIAAQNSPTSAPPAPASNAAGQQTASAQNPPAQAPPASVPAQGNEQAPNRPGDAVQVPPKGEEPETQQGDVFVFKKEVDEVTLHATVVDDHNRLITNHHRQVSRHRITSRRPIGPGTRCRFGRRAKSPRHNRAMSLSSRRKLTKLL